MDNERWKPVPIDGYRYGFSVSNLGRIRSEGNSIRSSRRILKPALDGEYPSIRLYSLGMKMRKFSIHRLVALAFLREPKEGEEVNHKNGNKSDPRASNLEWNTPRQNAAHAIRMGLCKNGYGEKSQHSKLKEVQINLIRELYPQGHISIRFLSILCGVGHQAIRNIIRKTSWKHIGASSTKEKANARN